MSVELSVRYNMSYVHISCPQSHQKDKWLIRSDVVHRWYEDTACKGCSPKYDSGQDGLDPILSKQTSARQKQGSRYFRGRNGMRKNLAGSFCLGFAFQKISRNGAGRLSSLLKTLKIVLESWQITLGKGK